ncbi:ras guanine nucleotide exchange factor domain-containing protein, partial [Delphinella strobiligena]
HTPFILAYSSSTLAAQFTLIEKDALDCIDWKDLVNLSWAPDSPFIRDWAQYTHSLSSSTSNTSSIDLIIARFNLVLKWCISSILLCGTAEERATCITKFIHIASYSHTKLHNFATMAQITIGLLSSDLAKLAKTWQLVPQAEKDALRKLEVLVSPVRNFAAIRAEMESRAAMLDESVVGADKGVIPFVGVYTRDLALNAQKPAVLPPGTGSGRDNHLAFQEQLINFERYRTAASIIKGVLKLLDASSRYTIQPHNEILGRCLWLAALGDGEIASLGKGLE